MRCFALFTDDHAFCPRCGKISTVFDVPALMHGTTCHDHKKTPAIGHCCLCASPICNECNDADKQHFSFTAGFVDLYYCKKCMNVSKEAESRFWKKMLERNVCAKHSAASTFECNQCGLKLCDYCSYFTLRGWLFKKLNLDPCCLTCFRKTRTTKGKWVSGAVARSLHLLG